MAILGIDEVGRGPWAGPLLVCACVLHEPIPDLTDSKKLTAKKREELEPIIKQKSSYGFGWISAAELDKLGLSKALRAATRQAIKEVKAPFHQVIIDGTINFLSGTPLEKHVTTLAKADLLVPEVSAASILAKVARDKYMTDLASKYPNYHFEKHVGYGTALHKKALEEFGACPEHRVSFKPIANLKNTTNIGNAAEQKVAEYLEAEGHQILERNWRTQICEIDIVSIQDNTIYFTEVKYRKTSTHGDGLDAITPTKLRQMQKAANAYQKSHPNITSHHQTLAVASVTGPSFALQNFLTQQ
ncbi:MAG: ribonuclease HII [Candidatus Saccharimonadales bacterium]